MGSGGGDDRGGAGRLLRVAAAVLGEERAGELRGALEERAGQFDSVRAASARRRGTPAASETTARATPASVVAWEECRHRIEVLDGELQAWAWTEVTRPAAGEASTDGPSPKLDGYAVGVKDVIDVAGMPTRSGSPLTSTDPVSADATVVARLRAAGAALVGKTHCTEWALNDPAPTRSPWDRSRTPGGSSAGSPVAVSTGMCTATVDTQTAGDVLRPAAFNGVVGFKPTFGWVTTQGTRPVAPSIDTIGVIARRVRAAAAVAAAIADDPVRFTGAPAPGPPRIGVLPDAFFDDVEPAVADNLAEQADRFRHAGADLVELTAPVDLGLVHAAHRVITFSECAAIHANRYPMHSGRYGPRARELLDLGLVTPAHAYLEAQTVRREITEQLQQMLVGVVALLLPVTPGPAPRLDTTGDSRFQIPWTLCGLPAVAIPSGYADGLPIGMQLVGRPYDEPALLAAAQWCEHVLNLDPVVAAGY